MPALVNFGGDDGIRSRGPLYCSPRKRSRLASPYDKGGERKQHQEPRSLDSLPDECLFEILRRLHGNRERSNSACVSKRWLMLLSGISASDLYLKAGGPLKANKKLVPDLNVENLDDDEEEEEEIESTGCLTRSLEDKEVTDVRVAAVAVGTAGRGGLGKLVIRGSHPTRGLTDAGLSAVARCCPSLKVVLLSHVPLVSDAGLSEFASGCPMLEKLDLCECPLISGKGLVAVAQRCPNLVSLGLVSCVNIGNEGLEAIGRLCPKLQCVSIKDCPLVGDQGIAGMMSPASSLTKLKLFNLNVSDLALACVGHYGKAITELSLSGLQNVAERGFWCMGNAMGLQKLKSLAICQCRGVTDVSLEALAKGCPNLKQLCLFRCCYVSDVGLKAFVKASDALEHLGLNECHRITLVGVLAGLTKCNTKLQTLALDKCFGIKDIGVSCPNVLPLCKSLRYLTIRDCTGFTSASLALVGKITQNLLHLDIGGLVGVTDDGLLSLIKNSEAGLVKVNLRGCINLTDSSISALVKEHGDTLELLNLHGCNKLTDRILLGISEHCTQLEELEMSNADVTDYGVALLASMRHLSFRILSFSGCSKITPRSLPFFGNMGQTLVGLNLRHCNLIKAHAITSLEEKMWWCDILS